jgi:prolipoprotein diacylglyceryltransferase
VRLFYELELLGHHWTLREYQFAYILGFGGAWGWLSLRLWRAGVPAWRYAIIPLYAFSSIRHGSHLFGWLTLGRFNSGVLYGGLFGAVAAGALAWRWLYRRWVSGRQWFDDGMVGLIFTFAATRVGCHVSGCCHGTVAPEGWPSVTYPLDTPGFAPVMELREVPLHPAALYEALGLGELLLAGAWLRPRLGPGKLGWLLLSGYAGLRFLLEFIRADVRGGMVLGLSPSQVLSLAVLAVTALALWVQRREAAAA